MSTNDSKLHDRCIFCKIANLQDPETRILYQVTNYKFELHDNILTIKTQSSGTCSDSSISYFKSSVISWPFLRNAHIFLL